MTAVVGRAWGWVSPVVSYRPWGSSAVSDKATKDTVVDEGQKTGSRGWRGLTSWVWGGRKSKGHQAKPVEEYYFEAEEKLQSMEIEDLSAGKQEPEDLGVGNQEPEDLYTGNQEPEAKTQPAPRWWSRIPSPYPFWSGKTEDPCVGNQEPEDLGVGNQEPEDLYTGNQEPEAKTQPAPRWWSRILPPYPFWSGNTEPSGLRRRKCIGWTQGAWDSDNDGELSDYGTPPPSPTPPPTLSSPFRFFAQTWKGEILPEHYEICFNFLRHLFDLVVVGFLWTVSPPTKVILDVLGVQGGLKLWLHGMAMFFVSTVGLAGLLWLVQEYLPEFALIYGVVQAVVISVSARQSVVLGGEEEEKEKEEEEKEKEKEKEEQQEEEKEAERLKDISENKEVPVVSKKKYLSAKERLCFERVGI